MMSLPAPSLEPMDTLFLKAAQDRPASRPTERNQGAGRFDAVLERVSAREKHPEKTGERSAERPENLETNSADREETRPPAPHTEANTGGQRKASTGTTPGAPARPDRAEKGKETVPAGTSSAGNAGDDHGPVAKQTTIKGPASSPQDSSENVTVTLIGSACADNASVSVEGLSEKFLDYLFSACAQAEETSPDISVQVSKTDDVDEPAAISSGDQVKLTVKLSADPNDAVAVMDEILSLISAFTGVAQKDMPSVLKIHLAPASRKGDGAMETEDAVGELLLKAIPGNAPAVQEKEPIVFKDMLRGARAAEVPAAPEGVADLTPTVVVPEDVSLPSELLARAKVTLHIAGPVEQARVIREPNSEGPSDDSGYRPFADSGTRMQQVIEKQTQAFQAGKTGAFSSIMAERLADMAEQTSLRDKPVDIMLRLRMENGDSLFVSLKDQAGKVVVNLRCADQQMYNLLQSQKDTITRHLEAKQVSASISVTPIEEDMTRRQGREQQKNMWGRQRDPFNPYVEIQV